MPAKDRYHDIVIRALNHEGWDITGQQVKVIVENRYLFIDIEAVKGRDNAVILVEVKDLERVLSLVEGLAAMVGKYFLYRAALDHAGISTLLYVAVSQKAYAGILSETIGQ